MDVIFCRNILIYFDKATQQAVLSGCASICGPAATCSSATRKRSPGFDLPLEPVGPTVFRRVAGDA